MEEVPRALEIVAHDDHGQQPIGRTPVSKAETNRRTQDYMSQVVAGEIPLDQTSAEVIKSYLDKQHARQ